MAEALVAAEGCDATMLNRMTPADKQKNLNF